MKKLVLLDIDRTLAEGSIGVLLTNYLFKKKLFPKKCYLEINKAIELNDKGKISYQKRGEIIIKNWAKGFKDWNKNKLLNLARDYFKKEHYKKIYDGAKELIGFLKKKNYYIVGISRAFEECLIPLKKYLGISLIIGTKFEYKNGVCTGKLLNKMWESGAKEKELMNVFKHANLTTDEAMAFGDTEDDYYMLKFVEFPITVNANKALEKIALKRHWAIYGNLKDLLRDLQSGKLFPKIGWFHHYSKKYNRIILNETMLKQVLLNDAPFVNVVKKCIKHGGRILEAGCGLGRTAISLSLNGFKVTAIDNDKDVLKIAKINCFNYGKSVKLWLLDIFELGKHFRSKQFDVVTHGGVLEHFSDNQIKLLLDEQLKVAPIIIFSVPIKSKRNNIYFKHDQMGHRHLWTKSQWIDFISNYYKIKEARISKSLRKDDLIMVITKR